MNIRTVLSYRDRPSYAAALLGGIALAASAALVIGHFLTREVIAARKIEDLKASLAEVIPSGLYENELTEDTLVLSTRSGEEVLVYRGRDGDDITAVAWRLDARGYAGPIELLIGVDGTGRILGIRVLSHTETPGLGDKIEVRKSNWIRSFDGLSLTDLAPDDWAVKKDGGYFDGFAGATITPRAVVRAVKEGLVFFERQQAALLDETQRPARKAALAGSDLSSVVGASTAERTMQSGPTTRGSNSE